MPQCRWCKLVDKTGMSRKIQGGRAFDGKATGCEVMEPRDEHGGNSVLKWAPRQQG